MKIQNVPTICLALLVLVYSVHTSQTNIPGPSQSGEFGKSVAALPNGNFVVTDPGYDIVSPSPMSNVGAVFLYDGRTLQLINFITGERQNAMIGSFLTVLKNGNFVFNGGVWNASSSSLVGAVKFCDKVSGCSGTMNAGNTFPGTAPVQVLANGNYLISDSTAFDGRGGVALCSGTTGCSGVPSPANSLILDRQGGSFSNAIVELPQGDYLVVNPSWNQDRGSVTQCSSTAGCTGEISAQNSLVGTNQNDRVGAPARMPTGITILPNSSNYVVSSIAWNMARGAATFCDGTLGCKGFVTESNSLVGTTQSDFVGFDIVGLSATSYVAASHYWALNPSITQVGAVTYCGSACTGPVTPSNSVVGSSQNDFVGELGVTPLVNGNYVIASPRWSFERGAVTFCSPGVFTSGAVSTQNSLVGTLRNTSSPQDRVGDRYVIALANGNYVVNSFRWSRSRGASTLGNGVTGITGEITSANSLIGTVQNTAVGFTAMALPNGNYVVFGGADGYTFCHGDTGCRGPVAASESLSGTEQSDATGAVVFQGLRLLPSGNYVVVNSGWNGGRGAVTWGSAATGIDGPVSEQNSLVGSIAGDKIGEEGLAILPNGDYVVSSPSWNGGKGAVTVRRGDVSVGEIVSPLNSFVGNQAGDAVGRNFDNVGFGGGVTALADNGIIIHSSFYNNGTERRVGAVSAFRQGTPVTGAVSPSNSVIGTYYQVPYGGVKFDYDFVNRQLIVGQRYSNLVTVFRNNPPAVPFDFDGDGLSDIGIYRPSAGEWWYRRSADGQVLAGQFGNDADRIAPVDFTGDGKTDLGFFRPSSGEWFILRSEDNTYLAFPFGRDGDVPVPGDYDADGKADAAVYRPVSATWYMLLSAGGTRIFPYGMIGDVPVVADYDGDAKADIAVYRPSQGQWWISRSTAGQLSLQFGDALDKPVQADYTGDGKADVAFFRPTTGYWYILRSEDLSFLSFPFGANGDVPAPGDYDGDGKTDPAVFRPSAATWYIQRSTAGTQITQFGAAGDRPVANAFVP